ncbi:MAG: outer membrane protein assembly factor BamA [Candidatus Marinimicrobia bacterium]|nr:outer membrane protein assembly factor BamA [Candidatus Neomarinimicrobiota bacterium]|tara:strand:- start:306 stop:2744 length:2439 start_codon:yes stop_codon:yes gene_type:complete
MKNLVKKIYFVICFFISQVLFAQDFSDQIKLVQVNVEGNQITSKNTIIFTAGLREGQTVMPTAFPRAIKRLWQLNLFQDIQLNYDKETEEGIYLTIKVIENYILGDINYNGNRKIKDSKFEEELSLASGQRIKPNTLHEAVQLIKKIYAEKGYLNTTVISQISSQKDSTILTLEKNSNLVKNITFEIKENNKTKIKNIVFNGNENFSDFRLRWQLKETKQQPLYMFWRSTFDNEKFKEDLKLLSTFYYNKGYRDFAILQDTIIYTEGQKQMDIILTISEGSQYKYRNFSWEGMSLYNEQILQNALALEKGQQYSDEDFNLAIYSRVQGLYLDRGYIYSRIDPKITPIGVDSLDVHFVITENHKVYINNIIVQGNTRTRENVIRRQLRIFPGDVYSQERIARSYREVMMLNFFANATPNILPVSDDKVDVEFNVEEKPAGQASANMGYSQYLGLTGGGGLSLPNFRGRGQSLSFSFNAGVGAGSQNSYSYQSYNTNRPKSRSASISFTDPMVNDTKNLIGGSIYYRMMGGSTMYYSPLETTIAGASIMLGRIFKWPDDYFRGTWQFQVHRRQYAGSQADIDNYAGGRTKSDGISIIQAIRRDSRDHPEFPTIGSHFSFKSTLSGWKLGGQENFHKHTMNLEWFTPTFWKFVLMNSMKIGVIKELPSNNSDPSYIPYNDRFIMGGNGIPYGNVLRGYDDNRVGPLTSSGNPIGGNTMIKFGTEFRVPFAENPVVYGMLFAEMGNVWSSVDLMERLNLPRSGPLDLKRSIGVGIRFFMPMIGMLGFDIGRGFDSVDMNGSIKPEWKTTLTFGQQF